MLKRLILVVTACLTPSSALAALTDDGLVKELAEARKKMAAEATQAGRVRVFRELKRELKSQTERQPDALFFAVTRLLHYADLVQDKRLDKDGCADSRAHIMFEAHPEADGAVDSVPGEAKEILGDLEVLCRE